MNQGIIKEILTKYRTIAIVGLSDNPSKPSHSVGHYLKNHGFRIVPINPFVGEVLGEKSYKTLLDTPVGIRRTIEIVDIFRRAEEIQPIMEQAVQMRKAHGVPYVVWMQLGIVNEQAAEIGRRADLTVIMDRCIMQENMRLFGNKEQ